MGKAEAMTAAETMTIPSNDTTTALNAPTVDATPPGQDTPQQIAQLDSTRFSHLAKKEAELQRQRAELKQGQTQLMTERQKMQEIQTQLNSFNELKTKDPVAALKHLGFSETDLFNFIAAQEDRATPEEKAQKAVQTEIQKFKDEQSQKEQELINRRNTETLQEFRQNITKTISSDPETFEYCNYHGPLAEDLIYETVAAVLETEKVVISVKEAAEMVEKYYEDQDNDMKTLKKRQPKVEEPVKQPPEQIKPQVSPRPMPARTLSSKTGATIASTVSKPVNETHDQKKARLISKYLRQ